MVVLFDVSWQLARIMISAAVLGSWLTQDGRKHVQLPLVLWGGHS